MNKSNKTDQNKTMQTRMKINVNLKEKFLTET